MARILYAGRRGASLTASAASFPAAATAGAGLATLSNPFAGSTAYAVVGSAPAQLALSGGAIVKGGGAATAGAAYSLKVRATSADGKREVAETFSLAALAAGLPEPGAATLPLYARSVWLGDSILSQAVGSFMKSMQLGTVGLSGGRLAFAEAGDKGIPSTRLTQPSASGGGVDDSILSRIPRVTEQKPDIIFVEGGHNDGPGTSGNVANILGWQLQVRDALRAGNPAAYIVWQTILPSVSEGTDTTALTNLATVNAARLGWDGTDGGKTLVVDVHSGFDYPTMTQLVDGIHLNSLGRQFVAPRLHARIAALYPAATIDAVLSEQTAQSGHGPNLVTAGKYALQGTTGTVTNTGGGTVSGAIPTGFELNNTTSAVVSVTLDTTDPAYTVVQIDIAGTVSTEAYVRFGDPTGARTAVSALPGEWFEALWGASLTATDGTSAPAGVLSYGAILPSSSAAYSLGNYLNADANANGGLVGTVAAGVQRTYPRPQQPATTNMQNAFGVRLAAGTANVRLRLWKPCVRRTFLSASFKPVYVGADGIKPASEQIGLQSGTVANGSTIVLRPGAVAGGGVAFTAVRIYKGGTSGGTVSGAGYGGAAGLGSGTLLATLAGGIWSWTIPAATFVSGETFCIEVDGNNSFGGTTWRSTPVTVP